MTGKYWDDFMAWTKILTGLGVRFPLSTRERFILSMNGSMRLGIVSITLFRMWVKLVILLTLGTAR